MPVYSVRESHFPPEEIHEGRVVTEAIWHDMTRFAGYTYTYTYTYTYLKPALRYTSERGLELWRGYLLAYRQASPLAVARAEAAWLPNDREGVDRATAATLTLARPRRSRWVVAELTAWRRRAGVVDQLSGGETAGPYGIDVAGDSSGAATSWRNLGCEYEAAIAHAHSDDDDNLRRSLDELQSLGAHPAAAIVARRLRKRGTRDLLRGPRPKHARIRPD